MKAILITPENEIEVLDEDFDLKTIQSYLGGWIEVVNFGPDNPHFFAYINEEGKLNGLPANEIVTTFWYNSGQQILLGDVIVGNALFFGQVDDEGNETDVPDDLIEFFQMVRK
jgi:hypothetical protein